MKKFFENGIHFLLSTFQLTGAPMQQAAGESLMKDICCEMAALGRGQAALELLLLGSAKNREITHILTVRTADGLEDACASRHQLMVGSLLSHLHTAGYQTMPVEYSAYVAREKQVMTSEALWMMKKGCGRAQGSCIPVPVMVQAQDVDWAPIYAALEGRDAALCIQLLPMPVGQHILQNMDRKIFALQQMVDMHPSAAEALARWETLRREAKSAGFANVNLLIAGDAGSAALLISRMAQALGEGFQTIRMPEARLKTIHCQPWELLSMASEYSGFDLFTMHEIERLVRLPVADGRTYIGMSFNPFSAVPENSLLPRSMQADAGLVLGTTVHSAVKITLPEEDVLCHTTVVGKPGSRKTTLLKSFIHQFHKGGKNVVILEPAKQEFRSCVFPLGGKVFTIEHKTAPLKINPFEVPKGMSMKQWKAVVYNIFKSTVTMPDPLPSLFTAALNKVYRDHGWTEENRGDAFGMKAFIDTFKHMLENSGYSKEVLANIETGGAFRIKSLLERAPCTFDCVEEGTPIEEILNGTVLMEMGNLEAEEKTLVTVVLLEKMLAHVRAQHRPYGLYHVLMIDEAHALFDQHGVTPEEKAMGDRLRHTVLNIAVEMKAKGMAVILADQTPSRLGSQLVDNMGNQISFNLTGFEAEKMKQHMGGSDHLPAALSKLPPGTFVLNNSRLEQPLAIHVDFDSRGEPYVSDTDIAHRMAAFMQPAVQMKEDDRPFAVCASVCSHCKAECRTQAQDIAQEIFRSRRNFLTSPDLIAGHIVKMPGVLAGKTGLTKEEGLYHLAACVSLHLLDTIDHELDIRLSDDSVRMLLKRALSN